MGTCRLTRCELGDSYLRAATRCAVARASARDDRGERGPRASPGEAPRCGSCLMGRNPRSPREGRCRPGDRTGPGSARARGCRRASPTTEGRASPDRSSPRSLGESRRHLRRGSLHREARNVRDARGACEEAGGPVRPCTAPRSPSRHANERGDCYVDVVSTRGGATRSLVGEPTRTVNQVRATSAYSLTFPAGAWHTTLRDWCNSFARAAKGHRRPVRGGGHVPVAADLRVPRGAPRSRGAARSRSCGTGLSRGARERPARGGCRCADSRARLGDARTSRVSALGEPSPTRVDRTRRDRQSSGRRRTRHDGSVRGGWSLLASRLPPRAEDVSAARVISRRAVRMRLRLA